MLYFMGRIRFKLCCSHAFPNSEWNAKRSEPRNAFCFQWFALCPRMPGSCMLFQTSPVKHLKHDCGLCLSRCACFFLRQLSVDPRPVHAQQTRGFRNVAVGLLERALDKEVFGFGQIEGELFSWI